MTKKILKTVLKIFVIGIIMAVLGLVALRLMFPPEKIKQITLDYAKNTLHREIKFDSVSINLIGITLTNFAMSEENSFEQGTFVKADRLEAKAALLPLLQKRVEISTIYLDGLDVFIQKNKDGSFNVDSFASSDIDKTQQPESANDNTSSAFSLTAKLIKATDCDFYYKDVATGLSSSLEDLNIQLDNVDMNTPFPVKISFTSQTKDLTGLSVSIPVKLALQVFLADFELPKAYVEITQASAEYKQILFTLQGKTDNFENPHVTLTGAITGLGNNALKEILPDLPNFTLPAVQLSLDATADMATSTASLKTAALRILDNALRINGTFNWGEKNTTYLLHGNLQTDIAQVVKMTDDTGFSPAGTLNGKFTASDKKNGQDIRGTLTLKDIRVLYDPFALTQTNGTIQINSLEDISCSNLTGLLNGEKIVASFAYKNLSDVLDLTLKAQLDKLILAKFPSSSSTDVATKTTSSSNVTHSTEGPQTYMNLNVNATIGEVRIPYFRTDGVTLQTALKNVSSNMKKTDGTISFSLQPGAITDMDTLIRQSKVARIILLPFELLNKVGKTLNLNLFESAAQVQKSEILLTKAEGKYTFNKGVMSIDTTSFESTLTNLNASGTANFVTNDLNMKASATLLTKQTPIVIKIGGTLDNPSGKVDTLNTVTSIVGGLLSYQTAKELTKGTASLPTQVVKGATNTTAKAASATIKETTKTVKDTVKALGSLFKKSTQTDQP